MRIAFLNPWRNAAENQTFHSQRIAAERIGHEMVYCTNSSDIEKTKPDFVLAVASTQAKLNDFPTYGVIHEPRERFFNNRSYFNNLLTYDGYLSISDSLHKFLANLMYGTGRRCDIGFYYVTCQKQDTITDIESLVDRRALKLTYFGTNWDKRRQKFFRLLSAREGLQVFGPAQSWSHIETTAYGGVLPFDGQSVQDCYRRNGIGLCLLSDKHLADDIVSNRVFEIASVGAIAICCDIPWLRKWFGNSIYYVDQRLPDGLLVREIERRVQEIYADPIVAAARARKAKEIFEENFAAERLIGNAVEYHHRTRRARIASTSSVPLTNKPLVSVIVRCGSRPLDLVRRAVSSVSRQSYGRFEIIFVRWQPIDLTEFEASTTPNVERITVVDCLGGNRSAALWCGLNSITGQFFSILDDDDWLFENHFEMLFRPPESIPPRFFGYSGAIRQLATPKEIEGGGIEVRELSRFGAALGDALAGVGFMSNCFVASRDLLYPALLEDPKMSTAEDTYLILSLLNQTKPVFSFAATSIHDKSLTDHAIIAGTVERVEDLLTMQLRLFGHYRPHFVTSDGWQSLSAAWQERDAILSLDGIPQIEEKSDRVVMRTAQSALSPYVGMLECITSGFDPNTSGFSGFSRAIEPDVGSAIVEPPVGVPWAFGAMLDVKKPKELDAGEYLLVVELLVEQGEVGIGLLNVSEKEFLYRQSLRAAPKLREIHIPIPDFRTAGRLILQNWEHADPVLARVLSLRILA
jgi:hypothetical protein